MKYASDTVASITYGVEFALFANINPASFVIIPETDA